MTLKFEIIIISEYRFIPFYALFGSLNFIMHDKLRHFSSQTCGTNYKSFVIFGQIFTICSWLVVITVGPCTAHQFHQIMITLFVFCKDYKVITVIPFIFFFKLTLFCNIHLATDNRFEFAIIGKFSVHFLAVIEKFLYAKHISMIGKGNASHPVFNCFVNKLGNRRFSIEK